MFKAKRDECKLIGYVQNSVRYIELHLSLRSIQNYYNVDFSCHSYTCKKISVYDKFTLICDKCYPNRCQIFAFSGTILRAFRIFDHGLQCFGNITEISNVVHRDFNPWTSGIFTFKLVSVFLNLSK